MEFLPWDWPWYQGHDALAFKLGDGLAFVMTHMIGPVYARYNMGLFLFAMLGVTILIRLIARIQR